MEIQKKIRIGVIGGARPQTKFRKLAQEVGRLIAEKGAILVCGGLSGVMEAAARGVRKLGIQPWDPSRQFPSGCQSLH